MLVVFWIGLLTVVAIALVTLIVVPLCGAIAGALVGGVWGSRNPEPGATGEKSGNRVSAMISGAVLGCLSGILLALAFLTLGAHYLLH